jgi:hydroxyacylglutathione hydrolase
MQVSEHIHYLKIPFKIPVGPETFADRFVNIYLIFCKDTIVLVDTGVSGSSFLISKYLELTKHSLKDIGFLILTHSHPDHIGDAINIQKVSGCRILAHRNEREWIENIDIQFKERPIPGFYSLVADSVKIDKFIDEGKTIKIDKENFIKVYFTPGHSSGSISLHFQNDNALICGDAVPVPGTQPICEDYIQSRNSIEKLKSIYNT